MPHLLVDGIYTNSSLRAKVPEGVDAPASPREGRVDLLRVGRRCLARCRRSMRSRE
jgi:hypothetical protein